MHDHCHGGSSVISSAPTLCLVGSPNVGKSAIFGLLTGRYVTVSNYPGTTVEIIKGEVSIQGERYQIVDTPGVNSLIPMSEDEKVTRDILLEKKSDSVIHVADSKNIKRSLFITLQLIEMGLPLVIDLNMRDEASNRGIAIDEHKLGETLGLDIVSTIAVQKKGIHSLKKTAVHPAISGFTFPYDALIEESISEIEPLLPVSYISRRSIALMILSGDKTLKSWLNCNLDGETIEHIESLRDKAAQRYPGSLSYAISRQRLKIVDEIASKVVTKAVIRRRKVSLFLDEATTHPVWGFPFLFLVLYGMYEFVGRLGAGTLVDFLEDVVFGGYLNPWAEKIVKALMPFQFLQDLTATFFIAFSIMEDSGYLPRLAAMLNKVFRVMGLNGKAVLPMVLGLGCDTMATLTTRILDTPKERLIVIILLALGVPCSAQLGVILGMFGRQPVQAVLIWGGSLIAVIFFVGFISSKVISGQTADFLLELPPLRMPQISNVLIKTMWRIEWYLKEAVPLFILGTLILFAADKLKLLPLAQKLASPVVVSVLGLPAETAESFIMGFLRRDYGAAGLFALQQKGLLNTEQVVVSLVTITLFIPCIANLFMIIKEKGLKTALLTAAFIFPFSIVVGGILHRALIWLKIFG
jgi:ferrous iron transport protein B